MALTAINGWLSEETALIARDAFALQRVSYTDYAWAKKDIKTSITSDEGHRQKLNGFLTVDVQSLSTRL